MINMIRNIFLIAGLIINGIYDIRLKKIPIVATLIWGLCGATIVIIGCREELLNYVFAIVPGMIMLLVSWITKQSVGYGDGVVLLILGIYVGWQSILAIYMLSVLIAGISGIILMLFFHKNKNYEIPFVPYLAISFGIVRFVL